MLAPAAHHGLVSTSPRHTWLIIRVALLAAVTVVLLGQLGPLAGTAQVAQASGTVVAIKKLMVRAGCVDGVATATHPLAYGTGECHIDGQTVTFATFDNDALRDQWVAATASQGGRVALGDGHALRAPTYAIAKKCADTAAFWVI